MDYSSCLEILHSACSTGISTKMTDSALLQDYSLRIDRKKEGRHFVKTGAN